MLVEMGIFDAYGAGFEFTKPAFRKKNHKFGGYIPHPKHKGLEPGQYTDDTQMAIGLAELMLSEDPAHRNFEWTTEDVAGAFINTFIRDPREGYAGGFYQVLQRCARDCRRNVSPASLFLRLIKPHSEKNGGAMRAGPLGLLRGSRDVVDRAMFQASLTHATWEGMTAAAASALMVHYFHYELGTKTDLPDYLLSHLPGVSWNVRWRGSVGTKATDSVKAALTCILEADTMIDVLDHAILLGGDTDTTAAIAGCAASRSTEIAQIIPVPLHKGFEDGGFGRSFLADLDEKLLDKFPRPMSSSPDEDEGDDAGREEDFDLEGWLDEL